ncbi:MAG: DUF2878 domain-containing protein [Wenzhouxiangellaceae bacterium]
MTARNFWINQAFFQASWPACVIGAGNGLIWPALAVVGAFLLWQLAPARAHPADRATVGLFVLTGLVLDTLWQQLGIVEYALAWPAAGVSPIWLLLLWAALGLTVHHSLALFKRRWVLFMLLTMVGSPLSYSAAAAFGAVTWTAPGWLVVLCMGPVWAVIVGALFWNASRPERDPAPADRNLEGARG